MVHFVGQCILYVRRLEQYLVEGYVHDKLYLQDQGLLWFTWLHQLHDRPQQDGTNLPHWPCTLVWNFSNRHNNKGEPLKFYWIAIHIDGWEKLSTIKKCNILWVDAIHNKDSQIRFMVVLIGGELAKEEVDKVHKNLIPKSKKVEEIDEIPPTHINQAKLANKVLVLQKSWPLRSKVWEEQEWVRSLALATNRLCFFD